MSPTPADHLWIRLAMIYAFIQIMIALWMPEALSLQRVLVIIPPAAASVYLMRISRRYEVHLRRFWLIVSLGLMGMQRHESFTLVMFGLERALSRRS